MAARTSNWARLCQAAEAMDRERLAKLVRIGVGVATTLALAVAGAVAKRRLVRLEVEGVSMVPVLAPGDRILVLRTDQIAVGDIIAFEDPDGSEGALVKRATGVDRNSVRVEGDNFGASRDSRHFGPVPRSSIIGRVLWCYWSPYHPPEGRR
jgi:nickel-type superoxide dismutase maturation protease